MKRILLAAATISSAAMLLSACESMRILGGGTLGGTTPVTSPIVNHACIGSFVSPAGNIKGAGIEIPIGKWAGGPIKIGSVDYNHSEAQKLSQAASLAEQSRLTFCRATDPAVLSLVPEASRADVIKTALAGQTTIQTNVNAFVVKVMNATTPQEAVAAAAELAKTAKEAEKELVDKIPASAGGKQVNVLPYEPLPLWATLALMQANTADAFKHLSDKVDVLNKRFDARPGQGEIRIMSFNDNGVSLAATERQRLYNEFQEALGKIPESQRPVVFIVGYANKSSSYLRNIDIGLRRAQTVRDFLQQQKFSRAYEGRVMSGGVDDSAYARRVDVLVTGA